VVERRYASLAEEVEAKTRKLKKVWHRWQSAKQEIKDLTEEFATERADMMEEVGILETFT
jgi:kinesin family protein 3/17